MFNNIGLSILSWKAPKTLEASLKNYQEYNFFENFAETFITFSDVSDNDKKIADKFNLKYKGLDKNYGIRGGMEWAVKNFSTEYILMVENDCPIVENKEEIKVQLEEAIKALESGKVDVVSFRHRFNRGDQWGMEKWSRYYDPKNIHPEFKDFNTLNGGAKPNFLYQLLKMARRFFYPSKAKKLIGTSVFIEEYPEKQFPEYIRKDGNLFIIDSLVMPWTNQSILVKKSFITYLINHAKTIKTKRGVNKMPTLEVELNRKWWKNKHFKIGIGKGFVTHKRLDIKD